MSLAFADRASRKASLVPVFLEPVTAMTFALVRARATRADRATFKHVGDHQQRCLPETRLVAARNYRETGSRFQRIVDEIVAVAIFSLNGEERIALASVRLSMEMPDNSAGKAPTRSARIAVLIASRVQSALMPLCPAVQPRPPRDPKKAECDRL